MDGVTIGWIGGALGSLIGIAGGVFGTYRSISQTETPQARMVMIRLSVYVWVLVSVFVALLLVLPSPYGLLLWIPYGIGLPLFIRHANLECAKSRVAPDSDV